MSYQAIICRIKTKKHENADRLLVGTTAGFQIVVGMDTQDNELGIYFPCDGEISKEFLLANNLYRKHPDTGEKMGGFFENNGRVRSQKFRGVESEGFWCPLSYLSYLKINLDTFKENDQFSELGGKLICEKYYTRKMRQIIAQQKTGKGKRSLKYLAPNFREHFDTKQLRYEISRIPIGALLYISEKCHGTSGRTGLVPVPRRMSKVKVLWNRYFGHWTKFSFDPFDEPLEWTVLTGTRRTVLDTDKSVDTGFYTGEKFRNVIHNILAPKLHKGETVYYEIVGYTDSGKLIMPTHTATDEKLVKLYGKEITYTYGCEPAIYKVYIYRITMTNEDGVVIELSHNQVQARCNQLDIPMVPSLVIGTRYGGFPEELLNLCKYHADGPSLLSNKHIREGICVRVEHPEYNTILKYKGYHFADMEGILKNDQEYIDPEDIS